MSSIISDIWYGNVDPLMQLGQYNKRMKKLEKMMLNSYEKLEKSIDEESKPILERYYNSVNEYVSLISEQSFSDGFAIASKLVAESFICSDKIQNYDD